MIIPPADLIRITPQIELLQSMGDKVEPLLSLLAPLDKAWQPSDFLPDLVAEGWQERMAAFRAPAWELSDETLVVLVGDMVTEEALPNYSVQLNEMARDHQGGAPAPWARWLRGWTAEENRHGDLLNAYLRLTGRVDMRSVEVTVHHLINSGFDPKAYPDPYAGLVYTAFQERATRISHANVAKLAVREGDEHLARICRRIAGDESRHEQFYTTMYGHVLASDPATAVCVMRQMLRRVIIMPGRKMYDGRDPNLFDHFAATAQRLGVYTALDYAQIIRHLVATWGIADLSLSDRAAAAQEFLCVQAERLESLAESITEEAAKQPLVPFKWIFDRMA